MRSPSLGLEQALDGRAGFRDLGLELLPAPAGSVSDAMRQVIFEELHGDLLQRALRGGYLGEDVDAVDVLIHHPLHTTDLAFDLSQTRFQVVLVLVVAVHRAPPSYPGGV